jgi:hypothetical protein
MNFWGLNKMTKMGETFWEKREKEKLGVRREELGVEGGCLNE